MTIIGGCIGECGACTCIHENTAAKGYIQLSNVVDIADARFNLSTTEVKNLPRQLPKAFVLKCILLDFNDESCNVKHHSPVGILDKYKQIAVSFEVDPLLKKVDLWPVPNVNHLNGLVHMDPLTENRQAALNQ